jgi:hypothetical protein
MKILFTLAILVFATNAFCQTYTYIDPDPAIEKEKKDKEAYFQKLISDIGVKLQNCEKQCGSYAADANNPKDPCVVPGVTPKCICDCRAYYNPTIRNIEQQEKTWRADIFKREEEYRKKKLKEQQSGANKIKEEQSNTQREINQNNPSATSDPVKEMQLKQLQTQQELNNAQDASINAFENSINSGKKTSGAMVDATLAGAQYISDPKASLAYTGVGLAVSLVSWISEKKEAQRAEMLKREEEERLRRLEELKAVKASLKTSSSVFNFISSSTNYHYTNLRIEIKRGMVKSVSRKDLYDVNVEIHKVINTTDSIFIYESVKFKNLTTSTDSCVISKISIPIRYVKEAQIFSGDYTNAYDPKSSTNQIFRHKNLTNAEIKEAFTIVPMFNEGNQIGSIHSNLIDVSIEMFGSFIKIQKKYTPSKPSTLNDTDFDGINGFSARSYMLVFDSNTWNANNFVDYLNFIKN